LLCIIVALYLVLAFVYATVTPIFETPDEPAHFEYARFVALNRSLPVEARPGYPDHIQTGGHPPLYYFLGALVIGGIDLSSYEGLERNPYFAYGPLSLGANLFRHTDAEAFPYTGTPLAVHLLRGMSILMGAGTLVLTYKLAGELFPSDRLVAVGAAAFVAFLPQFIFISASVNSDNLVNVLSAAALVQIVRAAQGKFHRKRDAILLGVTLGLAVLAKVSALVLLPIAMFAIVAPNRRPWRNAILPVVLMLAPFLLVVGWWFARNTISLAIRWQ
jgi:4-amino-4-deoxy-L-arabinose transferase-like glycosyltransferase